MARAAEPWIIPQGAAVLLPDHPLIDQIVDDHDARSFLLTDHEIYALDPQEFSDVLVERKGGRQAIEALAVCESRRCEAPPPAIESSLLERLAWPVGVIGLVVIAAGGGVLAGYLIADEIHARGREKNQ